MANAIEPSRPGGTFHRGFGIACWHAWTPGISDGSDWSDWIEANGNTGVSAADVHPDVSFLPALLRRRLDRLGRMALATAWPCVEGLESFDFVFGSRHGPFGRTTELLVAMATGEPVSPHTFSLAVHNNVAGLFSIARGNHSAATSIAAGTDTLAMSMMEGAAMIATGTKHVLVTYAEDVVPELYQQLVPTPSVHPFAVSLLLTPAADSSFPCALVPSRQPSRETPEIGLMKFLTTATSCSSIGARQSWQLERGAHGEN